MCLDPQVKATYARIRQNLILIPLLFSLNDYK